MEIGLSWPERSPEDAADRLARFADVLPGHLETAVEAIVLKIQADAARNAPVDTGRLRASIESLVESVASNIIAGSVGSNVEYALIQEIQQPYLRPAIEQNRKFIVNRVNEALQNAVDEVT